MNKFDGDFLITDKAKELIKNEPELRKEIASFLGEREHTKIVDEMVDAAKYYSSNGEENVFRYSFRLKDCCVPSLIFGFFTLLYRSCFKLSAILFITYLILDHFLKQKNIHLAFYLNSFHVWFLMSIGISCFYRFMLLREFFLVYLPMPVPHIRRRNIKSLALGIASVAIIKLLIGLILGFIGFGAFLAIN